MSNTFGFQEFIKKINATQQKIDNAIDETLEESATECVAETQARTPVKTGALRRSWNHSEVKVEGKKHTIEIGSPLEYAPFVENGHKQEKGKYVAAIGKKLVKEYVPGKHMLQDSLTIAKAGLEGKLKAKLREIK
ncbi:MAG: HK97 gp10 family phage protein [Clostridium sp.]|uniref:HK97 gp10 family phage protein n=1 Tax=Clostridium TaxID=1485 RepID=UPI001D2EFF75|nr:MULTISPECIES: HK97 gp10 family phage protein [Clostridium]DAM15890.1 MAG TPA: type I neck protein [Caudoviricetes sp.]MBS5952051.1 HK97 gp10 family phage protein [Clostridium sp.]MDU4479746.1 HK97 gp10 family phage protein [Clostridium sp.]CAI3535385.1 HK97 gp10 family phage protein [Clostridium neonatale]CAI3684976.1 HK97 gp10 family phage protein [Clostridium neonatale]